jgi:putative tricarboxylic transport membrane protein
MDNLGELLHGFSIAITLPHLALMVIGVLLGILVGVLPGLGAPNGVSLLLPLTFGMQPVSAIILLSSMYWGALFGGSVTSILFNIPGEPSSVATTFDGYPMVCDGWPTTALATAFGSAAFGALIGVILITFLASWVAQVALAFGPAEYFAVYFLAFASFVGMGGAAPIKTVVALAIGFAIAAIGIDTVSGSVRLTMGVDELVKGVNFVVAVMGLFGIGELLVAVEEECHARAVSSKIEWREVFRAIGRLPRHSVALLRSAAIGCWMGITPGGPTAASFMSYGIARRFSRRGRYFGTGEVEGIISPETADHAAGTSALLPMLSLGIPGSATAAVMMGGLMIWGLNPGPMLFVDQKDFVWGLIASMYVGNIVAVVLVLLTVPVFAALMRIPFVIIAPLIVIICVVGAYSVSNSYLDVVMMLGFGIVGYLFKKLFYPLAPLVLAIVIGDKAEDAFRQSMLMSKGSLGIFFANKLVTCLIVAGIALLLLPLVLQLPRLRRKPASAATGTTAQEKAQETAREKVII